MANTGTGRDPTHHLIITDGKDEVGIILTDPQGKRNERVLRRFPFADPEQPYTQDTQTDWSGGFGQQRFEEDRSKYYRGQGVDTTKSGAIALGQKFFYASGVRTADGTLTGTTFRWRSTYGSTRFRAVSFVASASYTTSYIKFWVRLIGTPGTLRVSIRSDSGGEPDAVLESSPLAFSATYTDGTLVKVTINTALTSGTTYWIVWDGQNTGTANNKNCWFIGDRGTGGYKSSDGTTWVSGGGAPYFRLCNADVPAIAHFFEYKSQLYAAMEYDSKAVSKLYMNGWRGAADANTGALTKLKDSTQTGWTTALLSGLVARMVAGPASREQEDYRSITAGASGEATVSPAWQITHATNDDYVILGSDRWSQISSPAASPTVNMQLRDVSDVAVAKGMVFFAQQVVGHQRPVLIHREYNNNGVWTADATTDCWQYANGVFASHLSVYNDPVSGPVLWMGYNHGEQGRYRPEVSKTIPGDWGDTVLNRNVFTDYADDWESADANVVLTDYASPETKIRLQVKIGLIDTISATPTAGGTGYTVGDILTIDDTSVGGFGNTATVEVDTVNAGVVTAVSLVDTGINYTAGAGKPTTGGTGTGCTIEITAVTSFSTGVLAYRDLSEEIDVRNYNKVQVKLWLPQVNRFAPPSLSAGDLSLILSITNSAGTATIKIDMPAITANKWHTFTRTFDAGDVSGADMIISVGWQLNTAQTKSFDLQFPGEIIGINQFDPIQVGEDGDNITGLEIYGDPEAPWVLTETGIGEIRNNVYLPVPLRELKVTRHPNNGRAHNVHDVYLLMSWRGRLQRFFRQTLEDLGPDYPPGFDTGGQIVDIASYAGRVYVAVDGGNNRASQVLCYKGNGWHEVYTSNTGERIRKLYIQAIPGLLDRLWISVGGDIGYIPIVMDPTNIPADFTPTYTPEGVIEFSYIYTSREDLQKLFTEIAALQEAVADTTTIDVLYRLAGEDTDEYKNIGTIGNEYAREFKIEGDK